MSNMTWIYSHFLSICGPPITSSHLCLRELHFELLHLFPQLSDDASVGVFIHHSMVDDSLGPVSIAQRGQRLLVVIGSWAHCGYHGCLAVATKVVLKGSKYQNVFYFSIFWKFPFTLLCTEWWLMQRTNRVKPWVARWARSLCTAQTWPSPFLQTDQPEQRSHSLRWWET